MSTTPPTSDVEVYDLDCKGLLCPLPVYKTALALSKLEQGDHVRLVTTDPGALEDIPAMARQRGDKLISIASGAGQQTFVIEKGTRT